MLHLDEHIAQKKKIYKRYQEGLKELPIKMNPYTEDMEPNFWLSCLIIDRDAMCKQTRTNSCATYVSEVGKSCQKKLEKCLNHTM